MPRTLTIEDGSRVSGANSYATVADAKAFALNRGFTLPATDDEIIALLVKACDYMETLGWKGTQVDPVTPQALQWPRAGIYFGPPASDPYACPTEFPRDEIPAKVIMAQCRLAYDATVNPDLLPTGDGRQVISEKVDVLEVHYSDTKQGSVLPRYNSALGMLKDFLESPSSGFGLSTLRV